MICSAPSIVYSALSVVYSASIRVLARLPLYARYEWWKWLSVMTLNCQSFLLINNLPLWHECQKHLTDHSWSNPFDSILQFICKISKRYCKEQYTLWLPRSWLCLVISCILMSCAIVPDVLYSWPILYLWSKCGWSKFGIIPLIFSKIGYLLLYYISPFEYYLLLLCIFPFYNISPFFLDFKNILSPPFWHWCQRVLKCNAMLGQKCFIDLKEDFESCIPVVQCNIQWFVLDGKLCC